MGGREGEREGERKLCVYEVILGKKTLFILAFEGDGRAAGIIRDTCRQGFLSGTTLPWASRTTGPLISHKINRYGRVRVT